MKKTLLKSLALAVVGSFCVVAAANALPMLKGGLSMTGTYTPVDADGGSTTIAAATGVDFGGYLSNQIDNTFQVSTASGDFDGLVGKIGNIQDFQFDSYTQNSDESFWSVGDFSFEMNSLTYAKAIVGSNTNIHVYGLGMMSAEGFDDTPDVWNFTGQGAKNANFSWSSSVAAAPASEPATMLLFGTGLIGLASIGRRRKKQMQAM